MEKLNARFVPKWLSETFFSPFFFVQRTIFMTVVIASVSVRKFDAPLSRSLMTISKIGCAASPNYGAPNQTLNLSLDLGSQGVSTTAEFIVLSVLRAIE